MARAWHFSMHVNQSLQRVEYWLILAAAVAVFVIADGPIWNQPYRIDGSIWLSYAAIPVLVGAVLLARRRFSAKGFLLETGELLLVKYAVTTTIAAVMWSFVPPPPKSDARASYAPAAPAAPAKAIEYTTVDPATAAKIEGVVVDARGAPVAGALVYVASGLEEMRFPPSARRVELANDGAGFSPELAVVEVGQELALRSADRGLHTAAAFDQSGAFVANFPMLAGGARTVIVDRALGLVSVRCTVHPHETRAGHLAVIAHPYHAISDRHGRFVLEGVPREAATVRAFDVHLGTARVAREPDGGALKIVLPGRPLS